jgi:O-antigen/teichoic acid export membrane protein
LPDAQQPVLGPERLKLPEHSTGSRLAQNTVANSVGQLAVLMLLFFATPYITRKLGPAQYGALSLLMTYLFAFSILNLGINASLVKYLAELSPRSSLEDMQAFFSTSLTVLMLVGLFIGGTVCLFAALIVRRFLQVPPEMAGAAVLSLRIASAAFVLQFFCQVVSAIPTAMQRFEILNLVRAGSEAMRVLGTVLLLHLGYGLPSLMGMVLCASLCASLGYAFAAKRLLPGLSLMPGFSPSRLRTLIRHSRHVVIANTSNQIVGSVDTFLIGYFLPVANLAYYGIAYSLAQKLWGFVSNAVSVIFPAASAFGSVDQTEHLTQLYLRGMKFSAAMACFPAAALCMFSRPFLMLWLGPDYAREGTPVLILLTMAFALSSFTSVPYQVLQATHYAHTAAVSSLSYMVINVILFSLLIPPLGIVGAALAFLTAQLLFVPWFIHRANCLLHLRWRSLLAASLAPVLLATGIGSLVCWLCRPYVHSFFSLALAGAAGFTAYAFVGSLVILDSRERETCMFLLRRWVSMLAGRGRMEI